MNPGTTITFDSNNLQTSTILTDTIDHEGIPVKDAKLYTLALANASKLPFVAYPSRTIKISGTVIGSSVANLDAALDTFRGYFTGTDKNLDVGYSSGTRRFIATVNTLTISRPGGLTFAKFAIEFICTQPFGQDTSVTTPTLTSPTGRTSSSYSDSITFGGTAPYQLPIITITLTATPGTPINYIQYGNAANGQAVYINRTWANGDVLVIDCTQKTVTVNGFAVAFSGAFPEFPPGAQSLQYNDGFSTRTFSIGVTYTKAWL